MKTMSFPSMSIPIQGIDEVRLPRMVRVRQTFSRSHIDDVAAHLRKELAREDYASLVRGGRIAVAVGSRGSLKAQCAVEGNLEILAGYGITEEAVGVPICASMEVVQIGELDDGAATPIYCDRLAAEADGIVVYNKVKPHTDFKGPHESGLLKMMAIGLAKHKGCSNLHQRGFDTFAETIPQAAQLFLDRLPVVFGVGVVQNAYDQIAELRVYPREKIVEGDAELLRIARERFPRFKFDDVDVLVTEQGWADLRGLSPKERARLVIERCAHPDYREALRAYFDAACAATRGAQTPHILSESFAFHENLARCGAMLPERKGETTC